MADATLHKTLQGHTSTVWSVAFSPDNKVIASASYDNTVRLWNIPSGDLNTELKGHEEAVLSVDFSLDGKSIVTGSVDKTVRTWSVATKQQVQTLNGHSDSVYSVVWSPKGDLIASGSWDTTVILWDPISGSAKKKLTGHTNHVVSVSFSQNGKKLASAGWDDIAIIWDVNSGAVLIKLAHPKWVHSVCFSPDDQFVVTGCNDNIVHMFNVNTGREEKRFEGHNKPVKSIVFLFGSMIASGSSDTSVRLWDVASPKQLQRLSGHTKNVVSVAFSRDGKFIASGSEDNTVRLWNAPSSLQPQILPRPISPEPTPAILDPTQLAKWTVDDVCAYLKQAEIDDDVIAIFRQQKIKGKNVTHFANHGDLQSIGIMAVGDRLDVISAINKLVSPSSSVYAGLKVHEIPRRELIKDTKLSEGNFGIVWRGTYNNIPVAIKEPKLYGAELNPKTQLADLEEEAILMTSIPNNPNVLQCYGISRVGEDDYLLVTELCNLGSLDAFLRAYPGTSAVDRRRFSQQIARGLNHLGKHKIIHRDVAARNVLLHNQGDGLIVAKVCDFGLSRQREGYYKVTGQHLLSPETAPEVFETRKHSTRSDVWSFGVLLWEVESLCATRARPDTQAFPPLPQPAQASNNMYAIMLECWAKDPYHRPSFEALVNLLA